MIRNKNVESLIEVVPRVLEQTAFLFPEPCDMQTEVAPGEHGYMRATLKFDGDSIGEVSLIVPEELCHELSANILGEDVSDITDSEKCVDAAREILNIITGQLLTSLFGARALLNLGTPTCVQLTPEGWSDAFKEVDAACFRVENYSIFATIKLMNESYANKSSHS